MFNTTSKQKYVIFMAYGIRVSLVVVLWGLSSSTMADIGSHREGGAFLEELYTPGWTRSKSHSIRPISYKILQDSQSIVAGARVKYFDDNRVFFASVEFPTDIRERLFSAAESLMYGAHGEAYRGVDGVTRDGTLQSENRNISNTPRYQIFDPITVQDLIQGEYVTRSSLYDGLQSKSKNNYDLSDPEHCADTTPFFKAPRDRFRIETYYQRTLTQRSWIDRYANSYHGVTNTIHCHRDYDSIIPSVEVVDKSLEAVYRPDGKMLSVRYEDRKGSSVFSEITLFF